MATNASECQAPDLMFLLSWASHALAVEHTVGLSDLGITPRSYCVLVKASEGELTQIQIAERCGLDKTTMVVTVDELERAGLAERRPSPTDRRARIIAVTRAGQKVLTKAHQIVAAIHDDVLAALPARERAALVSGLTKLVRGRLSTFTACENAPRRRAVKSP